MQGLGVIENDFHNRKDLTPNICAVYVEEKYRGQGIAGKMLNFVCEDMKRKVLILYILLLTTHHFMSDTQLAIFVWFKA